MWRGVSDIVEQLHDRRVFFSLAEPERAAAGDCFGSAIVLDAVIFGVNLYSVLSSHCLGVKGFGLRGAGESTVAGRSLKSAIGDLPS